MNNNISIGPFNIPSLLLFLIISWVISYFILRLIIKDRETRSAILNKTTNSLIIAFFIWKISPLVTDFSTVKNNIAALLYLPGSAAGLALGIAGGLVYLALVIFRMKKNRKKIIIGSAINLAAVVVLSLSMSLVFTSVNQTEKESIYAGTPGAGSLILNDAEGRTVNLAEKKNTVLVLNFWASWCPPCKAEIPELIDFYSDLDKQAVSFYSINLTSTEKNSDLLKDFITDYKIDFPVLLDETGSISAYFDVKSVPTTIIFDKTGTEVKRYPSAVSESILKNQIEKMK